MFCLAGLGLSPVPILRAPEPDSKTNKIQEQFAPVLSSFHRWGSNVCRRPRRDTDELASLLRDRPGISRMGVVQRRYGPMVDGCAGWGLHRRMRMMMQTVP